MTRAEVGAMLKALREGAGLTQADMARRVGVTDGAVRYWEKGGREPALAMIAAWARACGRTLRLDFPAEATAPDPESDALAQWDALARRSS